jgi:dTMP kinase
MSRRSKEPSSLSVLLRMTVFRRLWIAITVSSLGDWLGLVATTSLAAYLTKDSSGLAQGAAISGVLVIRLLPDLLLAPVAGALVDRVDRRKIAVIGDTVAGLLYLSIAVTNELTWLYIAQFLVEAVGLFTNPAKQAMWVNVVPRERLPVANQLNYVSIYGMVPVATGLFALLSLVSQFFGATQLADTAGASSSFSTGPTSAVAINIALIVDAATYWFCAGTVGLTWKRIPAFIGERSESKSIFSLVAEGVRYIKNSRVMRAIYIGILGAFGAGGLTAGVAQLYVYSLGAGSAGYSLLFGSVFTGLALGLLLGPKVLPTTPRRMIFGFAIGAAGIVLVLMSVLQDFVGALVAAVVMGFFAGVAWITGFTLIGQEVSDRLRGRVFAFVMSSVRLALLGTIAVGPVLAGAIGDQTINIGDFDWSVSGAGIVLACGGVVAVLVAVYASRQVGSVSGGLLRGLGRRQRVLFSAAEYPGVFVVLEGQDRVAAAAQAALMAKNLREQGWQVWTLIGAGGPDPDDTPGSALRAAAKLSDLVSEQVRPALDAGDVVLLIGFVDDLVVRFGAIGGLGEDEVLRTASWALDGLLPDLTVIVDVPEEQPESELEIGVAEGYRNRAAAAPERYLVLRSQGDGEPARMTDEISERLASVIRQRDPKRSGASEASAGTGRAGEAEPSADAGVAAEPAQSPPDPGTPDLDPQSVPS